MKLIKIKYLLLGICLSFTSVGCEDYLDKEKTTDQNEEEVFSRYEDVNKMVSHAYSRAKLANRPLVWLDHFSSAAITDECEASTAEGDIANRYNRGDWNTTTLPGSDRQFWAAVYESIRHVNVTLEGIVKYSTPDDPRVPGNLDKRVGELYFIRGYLHWLLVRIYGEIPYIDYVIDPNASMTFEKESVHAILEKVIADAEIAFSKVEAVYDKNSEHFGRVDKGACLGLMAIARWTAAVPLYNGAKDKYGYTGTRVFEDEYTYKAERWTAAATAAKEVIDYTLPNGNKRYSLYKTGDATDFTDNNGVDLNGSKVYRRLWNMFYDFDSFYSEGIFFVTRDKWEGWIGDIYPPSRGGSSRQQPVQEQVDEYEYMAEDGYGYPVYSTEARAAGYDDENPYIKRDPRFYRDVLYHGAPFRDNSNNAQAINTAEGGDRINASNATTTGYYLRKFIQDGYNKSGSIQINAPLIWRLPEFIYIYAEAINETQGPTQEIYSMINEVRDRSFMSPMPPAVLTDQQLMHEYIQRERRVEFFYENKRPFNCRFYLEPVSANELEKENTFKSMSGENNTERSQNYWKQHKGAYPKCQRMINGMRPVEDPNGLIEIGEKKYKMERFYKEDRVFDTKHILFPILEVELQVCPTLVQNPGW